MAPSSSLQLAFISTENSWSLSNNVLAGIFPFKRHEKITLSSETFQFRLELFAKFCYNVKRDGWARSGRFVTSIYALENTPYHSNQAKRNTSSSPASQYGFPCSRKKAEFPNGLWQWVQTKQCGCHCFCSAFRQSWNANEGSFTNCPDISGMGKIVQYPVWSGLTTWKLAFILLRLSSSWLKCRWWCRV